MISSLGRHFAVISTGVSYYLDVLTIHLTFLCRSIWTGTFPKLRARSASVNSDMSTTSDPIPGPEASIGLCDVEYMMTIASDCVGRSSTPADAHPHSHSGDLSMTSWTSRQRARLLQPRPNPKSFSTWIKRLTTIVTCPQRIRVVLTMNMLVASSTWELMPSQNENPRLLTLGFYLALLKADALQKHGMCQLCFSDTTKLMKDQLCQWTDNLSFHLWKCEDTQSPGFWRCPCCGQMVQCSDSRCLLSPPEMEAITADLMAHREDCYEKTLVELGLKPKEHDDTEETEGSEPPADGSDDVDPPIEVEACSDDDGQKESLACPPFFLSHLHPSHHSLVPPSRHLEVAIFGWLGHGVLSSGCFAPSTSTKAQREGDDDVRFKSVCFSLFLSRCRFSF
jgi:hypothetical protein